MKNFKNQVAVCSRMRFFACLILYVGLVFPSFAQTSEPQSPTEVSKDTTAPAVAETSEKALLKMSFEALTINDSVKVVARVRSKIGAKFQNTPGIEVSFYKTEIDPGNLVGKSLSNRNGEAHWMLYAGDFTSDTGQATYWAAVQGHPDFEDVQETVSVVNSKMKMELTKEDSILWVKVFVGLPDASGQVIPVPDVECKIYVKRMFGLLQVGDAQITDEEGKISMEFPDDIQGDEGGNITIIAKITGHEVLGNVETINSISWGISTKIDHFYLQRELWAARANSPIFLIVLVNSLLLGIWAVIFFIFFGIFRINRFGNAH